ncbi:GreA/GreB family elongation factor [bacterium]|nr:GreA/GreB family elongation factor [bacterium]
MKAMAFTINQSDKYTDGTNNSQEQPHTMDIITKEGRADVIQRVAKLQARKPEISERLSAARDQGGVEENEELHSALEDMQRNDQEIDRLAQILTKCKLLEPLAPGKYERVGAGMTVKLENFNVNKIVEYTILGEVESDPGKGIISFKSPLGAELINTKVGDYIELDRGTTIIEYEVLEIFVK